MSRNAVNHNSSIYWYQAGAVLVIFLFFSTFKGCDEDSREHQGNPDSQRPSAELYQSRDNAITSAVEGVTQSVVGIKTTRTARQGSVMEFDMFEGFSYERDIEQEFTTIGSGFIVSSEGHVLTNEHITSHGSDEIAVSMHDGRTYSAMLVDADQQTDIALLKIEADTSFRPVNFADSDSIRTGQWAIAIGNPTDMYRDGRPTVTVGVISASNRSLRSDPRSNRYYLDMIQTDATINATNAGGPLVDEEGNVIGINTMIQSGERNQVQPGLGYAVPSNRIKPLVEAFKKGDQVVHDFDPGFETVPVSGEVMERYNLAVDYGLLVMSVNRDGPAYECGILPGDVLMRIDNQLLIGEAHTRAIFNQYSHGDSIEVQVMRNGREFETNMLLRKKAEAERE